MTQHIEVVKKPCSVCGHGDAKTGTFVINGQMHTEFIGRDCGWPPLGVPGRKVGALCATCDPADYRWLRRLPRGAKAVLHDMVRRDFVDQSLADRYLVGHSSHRRLDPTARMMPTEKRLWALAQLRMVNEVCDFIEGAPSHQRRSVDAVKAFLLARRDVADGAVREAELEQDHVRLDRMLEQADGSSRARRRAQAIKEPETL